jgi:hypothetical protein
MENDNKIRIFFRFFYFSSFLETLRKDTSNCRSSFPRGLFEFTGWWFQILWTRWFFRFDPNTSFSLKTNYESKIIFISSSSYSVVLPVSATAITRISHRQKLDSISTFSRHTNLHPSLILEVFSRKRKEKNKERKDSKPSTWKWNYLEPIDDRCSQ